MAWFAESTFFYFVTIPSCCLNSGCHTCVSGTHNGAQCLSMYENQCSQAIAAFTIKAWVLATESHMLNYCEVCAAICFDCDLWEPIVQDTKRFSVFQKRSKVKNKKKSNHFRKVAISSSIPDALCNLHTSEYKIPRNKPADGYLWKLAKHNNVRLSKQLWFVARTKKFNENQASDSFSTGSYFRACFDRMGKLLKSTFPTL